MKQNCDFVGLYLTAAVWLSYKYRPWAGKIPDSNDTHTDSGLESKSPQLQLTKDGRAGVNRHMSLIYYIDVVV